MNVISVPLLLFIYQTPAYGETAAAHPVLSWCICNFLCVFVVIPSQVWACGKR